MTSYQPGRNGQKYMTTNLDYEDGIRTQNREQPGASIAGIGLEVLRRHDSLAIAQKVELVEAFTGFQQNNIYSVMDAQGQQLFHAKEENDCCIRNCFMNLRPFEMSVLDNAEREIMHISRPYRCMLCCCPCCLQTMDVFSPSGVLLGQIKQEWTFCRPKFSIFNAAGDIMLKILGEICTVSCGGPVDFKVFAADGTTPVGVITKQWAGFSKEIFTEADVFGVNFPVDLGVDIKGVLLATTFLIDFMYYESSGQSNNSSNNSK